MFDECKLHCNQLWILLHEDPSLERESKLKPVLSLIDRVRILSSLKQVEAVFPYKTEADLVQILETLNPAVRFLGDDYIGKSFTGDNLDIPVHFLDRSHGWSTTKYKQLITKSVNEI
jgi:glycerol-3-phosphate cytidylyltransferase